MDRETGPEPAAIRPAQPAGSPDSERTEVRPRGRRSRHRRHGRPAPEPAGHATLLADDREAEPADLAGPAWPVPSHRPDMAVAEPPVPAADDAPDDDVADETGTPDGVPGGTDTAAEAFELRRVGFPSRFILGQLAVDPRLPIWIRRAVFCLALGLGFTFWLGWRIGLSIAAVAAILDTVYQSKTVSLIPAAARVASAQRRTRRRLLLLRPLGYLAVHARPIPGTDSIIDHLVIGPGGVYAVDSERWDRRLPVRTQASNSAAGPVLYHGPFSQKARLAHARWEAAQATSLISAQIGRQVTVRPVMVIYGPTVPWTVARLRGVDVLAGRSALRYFSSRKRANPDSGITWEEAGEICAAAERALPRG